MTKRCPRSGKKSKDELPAITLNQGALSQLNDYNRAPQRLFLRAKRARHERRLLSVAAFTTNLARVSRINSFKRPASNFSFAFRHREKASPSLVTDRLGEMAILDYPKEEIR
jgi:hypothetical protein